MVKEVRKLYPCLKALVKGIVTFSKLLITTIHHHPFKANTILIILKNILDKTIKSITLTIIRIILIMIIIVIIVETFKMMQRLLLI